MGSYTICQLIKINHVVALLVSLGVILAVTVTPARAQEPTPTPPPLPYEFEAVDFESGTPTGIGLGDLVGDVGTVNTMGDVVATVWAMLDAYAGGGVLGIFVIILMGVGVIRWVAKFVFNKRFQNSEASIRKAENGEPDTDLGRQWSAFGRELNRRKNTRF